ncbi:DUF192 domain-containing protein [Altererythrobacter luteolus]|uniref:DUF192 domain-containing protein n=1 Tax=Pontixanthobacter luteolus TaxID=295089 RepID=A0A6I4V3U7_9SPHN|nr:DUF192 domain-containing protein [Pontixanthobacter luteolus]MXP48405.1 DUF192 domain-containing protein [Pontixanthobacter luteolus]
MISRNILMCSAILLAACAPQEAAEPVAAEAPSVHPVSGLEVVSLAVKSDGETFQFSVEVARTSAEQAQGLMFRTELGPNEGMIFPRNPPDIASFWMRNTPLPLDIIFVGVDGKIMNIAANTVPYSLESVSAAGQTSLVLEIPGGRAEELGIGPGDAVDWRDQ